jgi:hypothetical protein
MLVIANFQFCDPLYLSLKDVNSIIIQTNHNLYNITVNSQSWEACGCRYSTLVALVPRHLDVAILSPVRAPANINNETMPP